MRIYRRIMLGSIFLMTVCTSLSYSQSAVQTQSVPVDSSLIRVTFQERREYSFDNGKIGFSNKFSSARYNGVSQLNDSTFVVTVEPENTPINRSPWYAFKVWSQEVRDIYIQLFYPTTRHRYMPKLSHDGQHWDTVNMVSLDEKKKNATFKVSISTDTLTVAGQEIMTVAETNSWLDHLTESADAEKDLVGYSLLNRPIFAVNTKGSDGKKMIVIIGGQHPPESTGHLALRHFVEVLLSPTEQAKQFRKEYEIVIVPMLNPDGREEGHWRHNMAGVDMNRDWVEFKQPETRAFKEYLTNKVHTQDAQIHFAIDFHSTFFDVLYTNGEDESNHKAGLMKDWIAAFQHGIPEDTIKEESNYRVKQVTSKAWFHRAFKTEAVTYEIGDKTSRELLKKKSVVAAEKLMELLLKD
ncbi:hypothetical protein G5B00_06445 [Parapedobacter sp. SGR-10]|uniref:M14 family metallopeptidase n=1 Tax=Parapedobacter sp. SGR-10 TaxID=2710879 RepID=UPI0013D2345C|nr:M14 family metallopeptidase [Parapedobacter sp. SGR-10]NGF56149.1 hypothetical protein [Parapedobacter sp. SGR-10]